MSSVAIERGVKWVCCPCDILISEKVSLLLCFQNSKVWISALEEDRKAMAFDLRGVALTRSYIMSKIVKVPKLLQIMSNTNGATAVSTTCYPIKYEQISSYCFRGDTFTKCQLQLNIT